MLDRLARAAAQREPLRASGTNALRLVDGRGDGFEDLEVDDFAGRWLIRTGGGKFPEWLRDAPGWRSLFWQRMGGHGTAPVLMAGVPVDEPFVACENGASYWIDFRAGCSTGLFPDQRDNRASARRVCAGQTVLNCFAYTCAFGVACALGQARTVNIDLSQGALDWGRRNYQLNGLDPAAHEFLRGDVLDWLGRLAKKGRAFDLVILDPPTFSRDRHGRVFTVKSGFAELARAAAELLTPAGSLLCSCNQRTLSVAEFRSILAAGLPGRWVFRFARMPLDFCGEPYLKACWVSRA